MANRKAYNVKSQLKQEANNLQIFFLLYGIEATNLLD